VRRAISRALDLARSGVQYMVLELPTGYGKTVAGPHLYRRTARLVFAGGLSMCFRSGPSSTEP